MAFFFFCAKAILILKPEAFQTPTHRPPPPQNRHTPTTHMRGMAPYLSMACNNKHALVYCILACTLCDERVSLMKLNFYNVQGELLKSTFHCSLSQNLQMLVLVTVFPLYFGCFLIGPTCSLSLLEHIIIVVLFASLFCSEA